MTLRRLRESRSGNYPNGWGWNDPAAIPPPGMGSMRAGVAVTEHTSLQVDVVHIALRVLSNAVIKMRDPRAFLTEYDSENRPYRKWVNPQPAILQHTFGPMWQYDGRRRTVISMAMFGEAFWLTLTRDRLGYPTAIEVLHPLFVHLDVDKKTGAKSYSYGSGLDKVPLKFEDVTHIPFMAMPGANRGLNSIEYAGIQYALALAAMEYGQRWFSQGASPSFILSTEQKLGKPEVKRIAETFLVEHSGLTQAHLPLVVDSGLKAQKISSTPDEAQYLGTLEYSRSALAAWFGLPSHLVGGSNDKGNVWGKTLQEQGFQLVDFTLSGYIIPMEEAYASLVPKELGVAFNEKSIQRAAALDRAAEITALRSTAIETPNEIRIEEGKPPIDGGDNLAMPLNSNVTTPAPTAAASATAADAEPSSEGG